MRQPVLAMAVLLAVACAEPVGPTPSRDLRVSVLQGTVTAELFFPGDTLYFDPLHYNIAKHDGIRLRASVEIENRTSDTLRVGGCPRFRLVSVSAGLVTEDLCDSALSDALVVPPRATILATADLMACVGVIPADPFVNLFCFERLTSESLEGKHYYAVSFWRPNTVVNDWTNSDQFTVVDPRLGFALARAP